MRTEARAVVAIDSTGGPPPSGPASGIPANRYVVFSLIAFCGLAWDLWSKSAVFAALGCPGRASWTWTAGDLVAFTLQTNFNHGALWGIGQGWTGAFALLSAVAVVGILYFLFVLGHARSKWLTVALAFVLAGALGNLFDRMGLHGLLDDSGARIYAVRDFLYFRFFQTFDWAIFNFADTYLVTGAIMLVIHSLWSEDPLPAPVIATTKEARG